MASDDMWAAYRLPDYSTVKEYDPELLNAFVTPDHDEFVVRGPGYLDADSVTTNNVSLKVPSEAPLYSLKGMTIYKSKKDLGRVSEALPDLKEFLSRPEVGDRSGDGQAPRFMVLNWKMTNFWKTEYTTVVQVFERDLDVDLTDVEKAKFDKFLKADVKGRNNIMKFIPRFPDAGSGSLKTAVVGLGGERPVMLGNKLTAKYDFFDATWEITYDVGSSTVASMLYSLVLKSTAQMCMEYAWLFQADEKEELPERLLCGIGFRHCALDQCLVEL